MEIGPVHDNQPAPQDPRRAGGRGPEPRQQSRTDTVEISDNARAKLAELADRVRAEHKRSEESRADSEQTNLDEIRRRVESGFYERDDIRSEIARRLTDDIE